jgi:hypothetical protein
VDVNAGMKPTYTSLQPPGKGLSAFLLEQASQKGGAQFDHETLTTQRMGSAFAQNTIG